MDTQERLSIATMMQFMWDKGLSMEAVKAWSTGEHAVAAACFDQSDKSYPRARKLLQGTLLGVAAVGVRDEGWQTPAPVDRSGTHAGMQRYAVQRTLYEQEYRDDDDYFPYSYEGRGCGRDMNDGLNSYDFELSYWLVMHLLPLPVINFCDDRGRHSAFARLKNWSTAEFAIRGALYTCGEAIKMFDLKVVEPWKTGAGTYTNKPLLFVDSSSVGEDARIKAMVAYLPESNDRNAINAAFKVMAVVYKRSRLAPEHMSTYQVHQTMRDLAGFGSGYKAKKNITLASSASQLITECYSQLVIGGGGISTTLIPPGEEGGPRVHVKITAAPTEKICEIWNDPDAREEAEKAALRRFAAEHYQRGATPSWEGGVPIVPDDGAGETSGKSGGDDTAEEVEASPPSEVELTPALIETWFQTLSLYGATDEAQRMAALTAVGERIDALVRADASFTRRLHLELKRARSKGRIDGPADLSEIWKVVPRPPWDPASRGFRARALALREGLKLTHSELPELCDDDGEPIYDASTSPGFQKLLDQYRTDLGDGRARASLQKNQKNLFGSLEAMYTGVDAVIYEDGAGPASVVPGDRVDAFYADDQVWCAATVVSFDATTCTVHYDDGDDDTLSFQMIRKRVPAPDVVFAAGDHVHADWKGHGAYYGATVRARRGDGTYDLEYDIVDGNIDYEDGVHADRVWP